ncbi:MAG: hypothetical protein B6D55_02590 [Candidatus Omnitrophica bacterium 4484_70.2]|nr:MAG: hypothetical protein B6D55_02590 [Candidatus Omnitrophica bacterium 4484_70.2]
MNTLVLIYHNVVESNNDLHLYDVSLDDFRRQVALLKNKGVGDRMKGIEEKEHNNHDALPIAHDSLRVAITFDDGYRSWANNVLDILNETGLKAYFFICIEFIKNGGISEGDIVKLKNNGMVIGSHSLTHRFLHTASNEKLFYELGESKRVLEGIIQEKVEHFSVPRGVYNRRILKIAKDIGYKHVFTSDIGISKSDDFVLKRIPIKRNISVDDFKNIVEGRGIGKMACSQRLKDFAKGILGIDVYNWIRSMLLPRAE